MRDYYGKYMWALHVFHFPADYRSSADRCESSTVVCHSSYEEMGVPAYDSPYWETCPRWRLLPWCKP
jgi:hypothetical protein